MGDWSSDVCSSDLIGAWLFKIWNEPIVSILKQGVVKIEAASFKFDKEVADKFTKVNDQNYTLEINSGTIEMKDNKVIVLAD